MQSLIGHQKNFDLICQAFFSGRMPHAWLLKGPKGIGKKTFVLHVIKKILNISDQDMMRLQKGSCPDFYLLERQVDEKGALKKEITKDQVSGFNAFMQQTTVSSPWRVALIDGVEEMNWFAANAILKTLEEPFKNTLLFLVCHQPHKLMPTIKSRCQSLSFAPLHKEDFVQILSRETDVQEEGFLFDITNGSPGLALQFLKLFTPAELKEFITSLESLSSSEILKLAEKGSGKEGAEAFFILSHLILYALQQRIKEGVKRGISQASRARLWKTWEEVSELLRNATALDLDKKQTLVSALEKVA